MTMCLSSEVLMAVRLGEASPDESRHATDCALCAGRLASMRTDLARIDAILAVPARRIVRPARASIVVRTAPFAMAAAVALVLVVARRDHPVDAPLRAPAKVAAVGDVAEDISGTFATVDDDGDDTDDNDDDGGDDGTDETTWAASTCALDEPFIGVGCDNGVQLTALSW